MDHPRAMTAQQYDEVIRRLEAAGVLKPPGLLYHLCYQQPDEQTLRVVNVWESRAAMEVYTPVVLPIVQEVGIELAGPPDVYDVHNLFTG
jgi:hypothetical protein